MNWNEHLFTIFVDKTINRLDKFYNNGSIYYVNKLWSFLYQYKIAAQLLPNNYYTTVQFISEQLFHANMILSKSKHKRDIMPG